MAEPIMHRVYPRVEGDHAFNAAWLINAPWAHPMWSQYVVLLIDLTTKIASGKTPILDRPGMTHEFYVYAINPEHRLEELPDIADTSSARPQIHHLTPPNMAYQFPAADDDAALARIQELVDLINARKLSPDTDWRSFAWDTRFRDGVSLIHSIFDVLAAADQKEKGDLN